MNINSLMCRKSLLTAFLMSPILVFADDPTSSSKDSSEIAQNEGPALHNEQMSKVFMASQLKDSNRLFATGEILLWKAQQEDLSFAVKSASTTSIQRGKTKDPKFNWDFGFRVGLGYNIPHDNWDVSASYTQFQTQSHTQEYAPAGGALFPSWEYAGAPSDYVTKAIANWRLHLQLGDLELGKAIGVSKWLSIRPHIGVRSAWIFQKYKIQYSGGTAVPFGDRDDVNMTNNFLGIGGRVGMDSVWGLCPGFSIFGDGALSLLSGFFAVHQTEQLHNAGTTYVNLSYNPTNVVTMFDLALGFQYDKFFHHRKYHLGVKLGYEFNYLFDQTQFMQFISGNPGSFNSSNGDLSLMGVTLGFRFDF